MQIVPKINYTEELPNNMTFEWTEGTQEARALRVGKFCTIGIIKK